MCDFPAGVRGGNNANGTRRCGRRRGGGCRMRITIIVERCRWRGGGEATGKGNVSSPSVVFLATGRRMGGEEETWGGGREVKKRRRGGGR